MRILQLIAQSVLGGGEMVGFTLASELARRGHETLLLSNRRNGPLLSRPKPPGMRAADLPRRHRLDPRIVPFLLGHAGRFRPEVIHAHNYEASVWARLLGLRFPRATVVVHVHSSRFVRAHGRHRVLTDRLLHRRTDAVIALNEAQREFLLRRIRLPAGKLHLVPNGVDTERFAPPAGAVRRPHSAVCVASLTDVKNHAGLLRAWARVHRALPDARLTLVGEGPLRGAIEQQARDLGIQASVELVGLLDDVRPPLHASSAFVLFSHLEALPLSLLEAMAAGCVPVASAVGAIPEVIEDRISGRLVPPGDEAALAQTLLEVFRETESATEMARRARESVERRFGLAAWLDRIEEIYRASAR